MAINIETIKTENVTMNYFRFGKQGGSPLVIIPGLSIKSVMESAEFIEVAYSIFVDEYDVYVMDRRQNLPEVYSIEEMAVDTAEVIKKLGLSKISIISTSQGGMISMHMALKYPDLISNLIIASSSAHANDKSLAVIKKWISLAKSGDKQALMLDFADKCYTREYASKYHDAFLKIAETVTDEELKRFITIASDLSAMDISDKIKNIKSRVLVLGADKDEVFGMEPTLELAKELNCESYIYKDYGHAFYDEAPDCTGRIYKFLKGSSNT
ncbi:alpha/beta fold hydrolase [Butyrivibrio sp. WCE2006]|uniref:alpha/beta fold hydrolase n=1 Tax=Butyrivibrio sp. WCE2006 TaxID=1410611 RepID=UPI0005D2466B|nr:alpha/beta hydrolase [Butyrivibrio sp. WCE2006]